MPRLKIFLALSTLLLSSLACVTLFGEKPASAGVSVTDFGKPPSVAVPSETASCPIITEQIVSVNSPVDLSNDISKDFSESADDEETSYLVTYLVSGNELHDPYYEDVPADLKDEQNDSNAHQQIWNYFTALIPLEYRPTLAEFSIMTDGTDNILAAVAQTYDDPNRWGLEVDIADTSDYYYLSFTLVHEFAHLLSLGPDQVPPSIPIFNNPEDNDIYVQESSACTTFFPGEGCSNPDSYMNAFYQEFWTDIYDEWNEINLEEDEDLYYEKLDDFYYKYEDQFLTDYSVTHPAEDIAEAFGFFVFADQPDGDTIAEQKILFFYQYPELVQLRSAILSNLCVNFPQ
ncbi:MAG: hypothetical protein HYU84_04720 [Chloroflexi bacterium]|nr:hypothetical protein [Chloroflexota bacterium]MBI3168061.1 hypothetical protein [Chloroflexota bacterium]